MAITPYLLYEDVAGAVKFLSAAFGFKKAGPVNRDAAGKINHAAMKLGNDLVMMGCPGPKFKSPKKLGGATLLLYIQVSDADKTFAKAKKAGAKILREPEDTFYQHRRFGVADPEGHEWYFFHEIKKPRSKAARAGS